MLAFLIESFVKIINSAGYPGLAMLMALESMIAPVPSEAVMPFAGFLIFQGKMSWGLAIAASTVGSFVGSIIFYYIGARFGREFIIRYGRYLLLNEHHLDLTEKFFQKYGQKTIFFSRFIPVIRHFISLPAGASEMNIWTFSVYTILGAGLWNTFLTYLGFRLGSKWTVIRNYSEKLDLVIVVIIIVGIIYLLQKNRKRQRRRTLR